MTLARRSICEYEMTSKIIVLAACRPTISRQLFAVFEMSDILRYRYGFTKKLLVGGGEVSDIIESMKYCPKIVIANLRNASDALALRHLSASIISVHSTEYPDPKLRTVTGSFWPSYSVSADDCIEENIKDILKVSEL